MKKVVMSFGLAELRMHAISKLIYAYNEQKIADLAATMRDQGQLEPIVVNTKNEIISGNSRYLAAQSLGWETIEGFVDENISDEGLHIVYHNKQRRKTPVEMVNELKVVLGLIQNKQGKRNDLLAKDGLIPFDTIGKDRFDKAASIIGNVSGSTLRRLFKLIEFEKTLPENTRLGLLEKVLNEELSPSRAIELMNEYIEQQAQRQEQTERRILFKRDMNDVPFKIHTASCKYMQAVADKSVQVVVSSPPYYKLRLYGNENEIGHEETVEEFINRLTEHLADVKRVLKNEGSFYLNMGDKILNNAFQMIPERLVLKLCEEHGWHLINTIVWAKSNALPRDNKRLTPSYEKVYHLVLDPQNYYFEEYKIWDKNLKLKVVNAPGGRTENGNTPSKRVMLTKGYKKFRDFLEAQKVMDVIKGPNASTRQKSLQGLKPEIDHPALMTEYLPVLPILSASKEGDTVLDPFSGSGTVGKVALLFGRKYIGYEINPEFARLSIADLNTTLLEMDGDEIAEAA